MSTLCINCSLLLWGLQVALCTLHHLVKLVKINVGLSIKPSHVAFSVKM